MFNSSNVKPSTPQSSHATEANDDTANSLMTYKISFYQKRAFATQQQEAQQI